MSTYEVKIKTGDKKGAGTDANVTLVLLGNDGKETKPAALHNWFWNDFERGQLDVFGIQDDTDISEVLEIKIRRDKAGFFSDWFLEYIEVTNQRSGIISLFPILRWIHSDVDLYFGKYDTFLPQTDPRPEQRHAELRKKRTVYEYEEAAPGLPVQIKTMPDDENFTASVKFGLVVKKYTLRAAKVAEMVFGSRSWETFNDLKAVYNALYGCPQELQDWESDINFGWQRLNSVNSILICLCTKIPEKFGLSEEMVKPFLEGLTLSEAIDKRRLFIIDLEILEGVYSLEGYICPVPIALFFVDGLGQLKPLAIQLFQQKGPQNPVFLPSDPPYTWLLAKMWYNVADSSYHQAITHLGNTHLMMEGVCIATNRCLSPSHPMFKLLAPHFLFIIAVNNFGRNVLILPGGWMDKTLGIGCKGALELIKKNALLWRMDIEGTYPESLKNRGVYCENGSILPTFYQRDDSLALYNAIRRYVTKYVNLYYASKEVLLNDVEIQHFGRELSTSKSEGGCGILGVPFENGRFSCPDQLILVLTSVIFTSSVVHAAANFAQYDAYGYQPNYPFRLNGVPPTNKNPLKEEDLVRCLMDKSETLDAMRVTKILSERVTNALGDFEMNYIYDPAAVEIVEQFRKELKEISMKIHQRNEKLERKYEYLLPEEIPNAISI